MITFMREGFYLDRALCALLIFIFFLIVFCPIQGLAQSGICDPITPYFSVNLSGSPAGTWTSSPPMQRGGNCCGNISSDECMEFGITLDPGAVALEFKIASGAVPPGALFYQINCGIQVPVGSAICVDGPGPHIVTFCKPGNNKNTYSITSIPGPLVSPDISASQECGAEMSVMALDKATIKWNSVFPGSIGQYNSYLSCTSFCDSVMVNPVGIIPPVIYYQVCGISNAGGCVSQNQFCDTIRVTAIKNLTVAINPNPAEYCINQPGIQLSGLPEGGFQPYSFAWLNSNNVVVGTGQNYFVTFPGIYSLEIRDVNYPACPSKVSSVMVSTQPLPIVNAGENVTVCTGNPNVQLNGNVQNAGGGIWSGGMGVFNPDNLTLNAIYTPTPQEMTSGSVTLTLSSTGNGVCTKVMDQMVIKIQSPLNVSIISPGTVCYGEKAEMKSIVTGGTPPYSYSWNNGENTGNLYDVGPGTYILTVIDATSNSCSVTTTVTINENPPLNISVPSNSMVSCDSSIPLNVDASGGSGGYTYLWNTGETTSTIMANTGTYVITAFDMAGCSAKDTVIIQSANASINVNINDPGLICYGSQTTLNATASGGYGAYSFQWNNGSTTSSINAVAGNYCVTVKDSVGCKTTLCQEIIEASQLQINIPNPPLICFGSAITVNAVVTGGVSPYNFSWNTGETTSTITKSKGNYTVMVTDASGAGCSISGSVSIIENSFINPKMTAKPVSCFSGADGSAVVAATGGISPYSYAWSPYGGSGTAAFGLIPGTYSVKVIDSIGCMGSAGIVIGEPPKLNVSLTQVGSVTCNGGNDGSASITVSGGTPFYKISWTGGIGNQTFVNGLSAGSQKVNVIDNNGCIKTVSFTIGEPSKLNINIGGVKGVSCYGGSNGTALVSGSGGKPPYSFIWWETGDKTNAVSGLYHGNYNVSVIDSSNCFQTLLIPISQPPVLESTISAATPVLCNGDNNGSAKAAVTGGVPGYTYSWDPSGSKVSNAFNLRGGNNTVYISDANGCKIFSSVWIEEPEKLIYNSAGTFSTSCFETCDGSAFVSAAGGALPYTYSWDPISDLTSEIKDLCNGSYTNSIMDSNGCFLDTVLIINSPPEIMLATTSKGANCFKADGTASVLASGGFSGYSYIWYTSPGQFSSKAINLVPGTYTVKVNDSGGCSKLAEIIVPNIPGVKASINSQSNPTCYGSCNGSVTGEGTGGKQPYLYSWNSANFQNNNFINQLCAGINSFAVKDINNCSDTIFINITQPPPMSFSSVQTPDTLCIGDTANVSAFASGGTEPYTYSWNNGAFIGQTYSVTPTNTQHYKLKITDSKNCVLSKDSVSVYVFSPLRAIASDDREICIGETIQLSANCTGGKGDYNYKWLPGGQTGSSVAVTPTVSTIYQVMVSDECGSPGGFDPVRVTVHQLPSISFSVSDSTGCSPLCVQFKNNSSVQGEKISRYKWEFGDGEFSVAENPIHCYTNSGSYNIGLRATSEFGCSRSETYTGAIRVFPNPDADFAISSNIVNIAKPRVYFTDLSKEAKKWKWNFGDQSGNLSFEQNPEYFYSDTGNFCVELEIENANGCLDTVTHCLYVRPDFSIFIPTSFSPNNDGLNDQFTATGSLIENFELWIFDRWGDQIFHSKNPDHGWDGKANGGRDVAQQDVYVYKLLIKDTYGKKYDLYGHITLVK